MAIPTWDIARLSRRQRLELLDELWVSLGRDPEGDPLTEAQRRALERRLDELEPEQLEYEVAYNLHCQLTLRSGRSITLEALHQEMTYAGLIMGTPSAETNEWDTEAALRDAQAYSVAGSKPHLIPPTQRDYLRVPGDMSDIGSAHHRPEWLPMVRRIASFKDVSPVRDREKDLSVLTVVWYRDEYAPPILEPALSQSLDIDWESHAADVDL